MRHIEEPADILYFMRDWLLSAMVMVAYVVGAAILTCGLMAVIGLFIWKWWVGLLAVLLFVSFIHTLIDKGE